MSRIDIYSDQVPTFRLEELYRKGNPVSRVASEDTHNYTTESLTRDKIWMGG